MFRVGIGHDTHRFLDPPADGAAVLLRLGGIGVPYTRRLKGHSDADVVLHAVADALLGAAALGDIGDHFPDTDPALRGCDSAWLLAEVKKLVDSHGYRLQNLDVIIFAEAPKLGPLKPQMAARIAEILAIPVACVNVKAKTGEKIGIIGRGEAICAEAAVLLEWDVSTAG